MTASAINRMLPGSLAERYDAYQHGAARGTHHPDTVALDLAVQVTTAAVLLEEGVEGAEERHAPESSRSYCLGVPVTVASSSRASTRYWITWSARSSSVCGMVSPRALAVLRLIASSNFVGCSMGRSPGLAPLRILSI
jgi:hypothetical protein